MVDGDSNIYEKSIYNQLLVTISKDSRALGTCYPHIVLYVVLHFIILNYFPQKNPFRVRQIILGYSPCLAWGDPSLISGTAPFVLSEKARVTESR